LHELVFGLLKEHYHDLFFSLLVLKSSRNQVRAKTTGEILARFKVKRPAISREMRLIRSSLLLAAVTWNERVIQRIADAYDHLLRQNIDKMVETLRSILVIVQKPICEMHDHFLKQYQKSMTQLDSILNSFSKDNSTSMNQLSQWCKTIQTQITEELKQIKTIQLSSISPELCAKSDFTLAVPGTYQPNKELITIAYFVGQIAVHVSKQQPKDVVIKGQDGNFYQYLLKGHEDLRLDERIMQFFRLINSLIVKDTKFNANVIQTLMVIPLSLSHGLVQWATGTDTLRAVLEQYRKLHAKDALLEYTMIDEMGWGNYDFLQPLQKNQILETIFEKVPNTDIAKFFWMKAGTAENWWKQTSRFSTSCAIMSIVGYIIGLGDRHPSNLLVDRFSGRVVHIDFGDCFERAATRRYLPEVVPFRLTRMMVEALGVGGVDGLFRSTFVYMARMLRQNGQVLEMVLSVFVHEPLVDPDATDESLIGVDSEETLTSPALRQLVSKAPTGSIVDVGRVYMTAEDRGIRSTVEMGNRIRQKLTGADMGDGTLMTVEEQAQWLIESATSTYNLAKMYSGWCPFW
jgi:phosphatidylinositol kinase/protein kinase (PI-3  family)